MAELKALQQDSASIDLETSTAEFQRLSLLYVLQRTKEAQLNLDTRYNDMKACFDRASHADRPCPCDTRALSPATSFAFCSCVDRAGGGRRILAPTEGCLRCPRLCTKPQATIRDLEKQITFSSLNLHATEISADQLLEKLLRAREDHQLMRQKR